MSGGPCVYDAKSNSTTEPTKPLVRIFLVADHAEAAKLTPVLERLTARAAEQVDLRWQLIIANSADRTATPGLISTANADEIITSTDLATAVHLYRANPTLDTTVTLNYVARSLNGDFVAFMTPEHILNKADSTTSLIEALRLLISHPGDMWTAIQEHNSFLIRSEVFHAIGGIMADVDQSSIAGLHAVIAAAFPKANGTSFRLSPGSSRSNALDERIRLIRKGVAWPRRVRKISVLTPLHPDYLQFFDTSIKSVLTQQADTPVEWCIQADGSPDAVARAGLRARVEAIEAPGWLTIRYAENGRQAGEAVTRNGALTRATGDVVIGLDPDDAFMNKALHFVQRVFNCNPRLGWLEGAAKKFHATDPTAIRDLMNDYNDLIDGYFPEEDELRLTNFDVGEFASETSRPSQTQHLYDRGAFLGETTFAARTNLVRLLGGWSALGRDGDVDLLQAAAAITPGANGRPLRFHREWPGSLTQQQQCGDYDAIRARLAAASLLRPLAHGLDVKRDVFDPTM